MSFGLKILREHLCRFQSNPVEDRPADISAKVAHLINEIDVHRPLDAGGKHGDLHTPTCGCEDK